MSDTYIVTVTDKHDRQAHFTICPEYWPGEAEELGDMLRQATQSLEKSKEEKIYARTR